MDRLDNLLSMLHGQASWYGGFMQKHSDKQVREASLRLSLALSDAQASIAGMRTRYREAHGRWAAREIEKQKL